MGCCAWMHTRACVAPQEKQWFGEMVAESDGVKETLAGKPSHGDTAPGGGV